MVGATASPRPAWPRLRRGACTALPKPPTGLAGLRARLNLTDKATPPEIANSALALIAQLEDELSKPPRGDRLEIQSSSKYQNR